MSDTVEPLILDLLEWIGQRPRPYAEVLEAWRTSCPRLPVWEEANASGLIDHIHEQGRPALVAVSPRGRDWMAARRTRRANATDAIGDRHAQEPSRNDRDRLQGAAG